MNSFDVTKRRTLYFIIPLLVIVAGIVCMLTMGLSNADDLNGSTVYYAGVDAQVDLSTVDEYALFEDVQTAIGRYAGVSIEPGYGYYGSRVAVILDKGASIDEKALVDMFAEKYADFNVESLSSVTYAGSIDGAALASYGAVLAVLLIVLFLINWFFIGVKYSLQTLLITLTSAFAVASVYVISRADSFIALAASVMAAVVITQAVAMIRYKALEKRFETVKKPDAKEIANETASLAAKQGFSMTVTAALFLASFTVAGVAMSSTPLIYLAALIFIAAVFPIYAGVFLIPNLWAKGK